MVRSKDTRSALGCLQTNFQRETTGMNPPRARTGTRQDCRADDAVAGWRTAKRPVDCSQPAAAWEEAAAAARIAGDCMTAAAGPERVCWAPGTGAGIPTSRRSRGRMSGLRWSAANAWSRSCWSETRGGCRRGRHGTGMLLLLILLLLLLLLRRQQQPPWSRSTRCRPRPGSWGTAASGRAAAAASGWRDEVPLGTGRRRRELEQRFLAGRGGHEAETGHATQRQTAADRREAGGFPGQTSSARRSLCVLRSVPFWTSRPRSACPRTPSKAIDLEKQDGGQDMGGGRGGAGGGGGGVSW